MKVEGGAEAAIASKEKKQKRIWTIILSCLGVVIIGLVIAIVVVIKVREDKSNCTPMSEMTEEEIQRMYDDYDFEAYTIINNAIDKIIEATSNLEESDVVRAYQYYIDETENTEVRNMLRINLLVVEMGYDTEKTRGDELIAVAKEIDEESKSINSAALVVMLAENYGKTDIFDEYNTILTEREANEGVDETEGEG